MALTIKFKCSFITSKGELQTYKYNGPTFTSASSWVLMDYLTDTPSGDPLHYAYVDCGAVWNEVTGFWELNGLKDLTNKDIRKSYNDKCALTESCLYGSKIRTNFPFNIITKDWGYKISLLCNFAMCENMEVLNLGNVWVENLNMTFHSCSSLVKVLGSIYMGNNTGINVTSFSGCSSLESISILNLCANASLTGCPKLSTQSIASMINRAGGAQLTIKLHSKAYARAMADASVQAALAAKPNVSLAGV